MMQLDMTAYVAPTTSPTFGIVTDFTDAQLNAFIRALIDTYIPTTPWKDTKCGYACSDHGSWDKAGYRASLPFESPFEHRNMKIHTISDLLDILDLGHAKSYAQLGLSFVVELSLD